MRVGLLLLTMICTFLMAGCSEDSPVAPMVEEPATIDVVFTYVKVTTSEGCCDPGDDGGEVRGQLRAEKTGENYVVLYSFGGTLSRSRTLNKSRSFTLGGGELLRAFSSGLHEEDTWPNDDEGIDEFQRRWTFEELTYKLPDAEAEIVEVFHCDGDGGNCYLDIHCRITRAE